MKSLIITLLIFTGFLNERYIRDTEKFCNHVDKWEYCESRPVCPVPVEWNSYTEDLLSDNIKFVQEKPKPTPLLIAGDIRCDGLLCPIPPIESQLNRPDPELSNGIIQELLQAVYYLELIYREDKTKMGEDLMDFFLQDMLIPIIHELCLFYLYKMWRRRNNRDVPAG